MLKKKSFKKTSMLKVMGATKFLIVPLQENLKNYSKEIILYLL